MGYALDANKEKEEMSEWIGVKDRLPEPNNWILYEVLVNDPKLYRHQIAYYSISKKWIIESAQHRFVKVTHWYPLPSGV
jgi:hypothetical protein